MLVLLFGADLVTAADAQPVCLNVQTAGAIAHYPIAVGEKLSLVFAHSIYGSRVEEDFRLTAQGFQIVELRYGEPRLVEFYGHEWAANTDGWWIVRKLGAVLTTLDLQVSSDSWIGITFGTEKLTLTHSAPSEGRARLLLSACPGNHDG